jgi:hypothetical protein
MTGIHEQAIPQSWRKDAPKLARKRLGARFDRRLQPLFLRFSTRAKKIMPALDLSNVATLRMTRLLEAGRQAILRLSIIPAEPPRICAPEAVHLDVVHCQPRPH